MKSISKFISICLLLLVSNVLPAHAVSLGFGILSRNSLADATIGESQLFVDMTDPFGRTDLGADQVLFTFNNIGPYASSITGVYFDDGTLLGIAHIDDSHSGVSFDLGANPGELPARNNISPPFETTEGFLADSDPAVQPNGVNPGEYLSVLFNLQSSQTLEDVIEDLRTGDLRIGIRVQGFEGGGSESFVNVPEPSLSFMFLLISGFIIIFCRKTHAFPAN